ncbi:CIC11C00000001854 [Sungouiella intermedia]|uniref:Glutamate--cysteine ligase n=1 Tax=Sungouiella intermedia TaxID=45354 RepID=A0A1L0CZQ4_9ASCO|nr:CIC11C00000001854 [[Candida] intermedia]
MGLLLAPVEKYNDHVRENGIEQLINIFRQHGKRDNDHFYWGDEVEYMLVDIDDTKRTARLAIDKDSILDDLNDPEKPEVSGKALDNNISFHPEYGRYMIEATPLRPYDGQSLDDYLYVEENMVKRREVSQSELPANIIPLTLDCISSHGLHVRFPTLTANIRKRRGTKVSINLPIYPDENTKLIDDSIPHRDLFPSDKEPFLGSSKPGHVYMDSMGFGMASNIAQARYLYDSLVSLTPVMLAVSAAAPVFKGFLVDQDVRWNVISGAVDDRTFIERDVEPYEGTDYFGGLDVNQRTKSHFKHLGGGRGVNGDKVINEFGDIGIHTLDGKPIQKIPKSRYESVDTYLSDEGYHESPYFSKSYNDIFSPINKKVFDKLKSTQHFDDVLAHHFAHLFIRDPIVIFNERVDQDNTQENDHFENIQLTNWQTLRFKPPALYPPETPAEELAQKPGWRVEFRPLEIQLSDFENAAYSVFIILVGKVILKYNPDFYIPILKVDQNMETAHKVDAAIHQRFWFKNPTRWNVNNEDFKGYDLSWFDRFIHDGNDLFNENGVYLNGYSQRSSSSCTLENDGEEGPNEVKMSADELINGTDKFPGLVRMIIKYIATDLIPEAKTNSVKHCKNIATAKELWTLQSYLRLISGRASGRIPTIARFLRDFVLKHPDYKKDSKVSDSINYDLVNAAVAITNLDATKPELLTLYYGKDIYDYLKSR